MYHNHLKHFHRVVVTKTDKYLTYYCAQDYQLALLRFCGSHNDPVNLYLNYAKIAQLPDQASRHNAPARPHALTKVVKSETFDVNGGLIVVSIYGLIVVAMVNDTTVKVKYKCTKLNKKILTRQKYVLFDLNF